MAAGHVEVVYSPAAREVVTLSVPLARLPAGATVADAIAASGLAERLPGLAVDPGRLGIWGRRTTPTTPVRDGDRIEIYRPLQVDPKEARRLRYRQQGPVKSRHRAGGRR